MICLLCWHLPPPPRRKLGHTIKLLVASQLVALAQLLLFTLVNTSPSLFTSFGFLPGERPALAAFILFQYVIGPLDEVREVHG